MGQSPRGPAVILCVRLRGMQGTPLPCGWCVHEVRLGKSPRRQKVTRFAHGACTVDLHAPPIMPDCQSCTGSSTQEPTAQGVCRKGKTFVLGNPRGDIGGNGAGIRV